jgi:hypothetical protein
MAKPLKIFFLLLFYFIESGVSAAGSFQLERLQYLFNAYQRQAAYDYAQPYVKQMEGDPYFDFLYGVAAIDSGHVSEGVFALERVLFVFPQDHVARLELARGYFILEEYTRAREEFEKVLKTSPPQGVRDTTQVFLDRIRLQEARYRTTSNGYLELGLGSDSNVNSGATVDDLSFPVLGLVPTSDDDSVGQDDNFSRFAGSWQVTHPFSPGWMANAAITGEFKKNQDFDQFDTSTATLQAGITRLSKFSRYKANIVAQQFQLDGNEYRSMSALNLEWRYASSRKSSFTTLLQYATLEYPDFDNKNSDLVTLGLGYHYVFSAKMSPTLFANLQFGQENAENAQDPAALANTERDFNAFRLGLVLSLTPKLALQTSVGLQTSEYAGPQAFFAFNDAIREDDYSSTDINLLWLLDKHWRLDSRLSYAENSSNVQIYKYDRTVFSLNLNYAF